MSTLHLVDPAARDVVVRVPMFDPDRQTVEQFRTAVLDLYARPGPAAPLKGEARWIPGPADGPAVRVLVYRPDAASGPVPAILYHHGDGLIAGSPDMIDDASQALSERTGAVVVAVAYRLAPETPFPGAVEDGQAALDWLVGEADALGVDPARIIVMGQSAGGAVAAGVTLLNRDRGRHRLAGQVLVYPMLDPRTGTPDAPVDNPTTGEFMWSRAANRFGWSALRGRDPIAPERLGHYAPALAGSLSDLPPAFIAVGSLDLFLEEDVAYALRLSRVGVPIELHVYPGGVHGLDALPGPLAERFAADLHAAIRRMLRDN